MPETYNQGIINTYESTASDDVAVSDYSPSTTSMDYDTDTVEGRVQGIIAKNSAPMRQARSRSQQAMEGRGLLNSSLAVGAGESALYDYSLPMASQDANASIQNKQFNVGQMNEAGRFNAGESNKFGLLDVQGRQQLEQTAAQGNESRLNIGAQGRESRLNIGAQGRQSRLNIAAQGEVDLGLMNRKNELDQILITAEGDQRVRAVQERAAVDVELQIMANQNRIDTQSMSDQNAQLLQTIANEYAGILQGSRDAMLVYTTGQAAIGEILADPDLTPEAKQVLVDAALRGIEDGLTLVGGILNMDLNGLYSGYPDDQEGSGTPPADDVPPSGEPTPDADGRYTFNHPTYGPITGLTRAGYDQIEAETYGEQMPDANTGPAPGRGDYAVAERETETSCFVAGTPIDMAGGGFKNIEHIAVGDEVNTQNGSLDTVTFVHDIPEALRTLVTINDRITCTDSHPFLTEDGWKSCNPEASKPTYEEYDIEIGQLRVGDNLVTVNGLEEVTELISREELAKVYNFTTDRTHTYLVDGVVAHNKSYATGNRDGSSMIQAAPREEDYAVAERETEINCFVAGTPIDMADGSSKNIEDIIVDDEVNTQDGSLDTVIHVHDIPEGLKTLVTINDRITCTDSHPFLTEEGWKSFNPEASKPTYEEYGIEIGQLEVGDNLVTVNGLEEVTELISREELAKVYNFTTDRTHTYLVDGVVAHNKSRPQRRAGESWFDYHARIGTPTQSEEEARAAGYYRDSGGVYNV